MLAHKVFNRLPSTLIVPCEKSGTLHDIWLCIPSCSEVVHTQVHSLWMCCQTAPLLQYKHCKGGGYESAAMSGHIANCHRSREPLVQQGSARKDLFHGQNMPSIIGASLQYAPVFQGLSGGWPMNVSRPRATQSNTEPREATRSCKEPTIERATKNHAEPARDTATRRHTLYDFVLLCVCFAALCSCT